jgi:hypothetical protein
MSPNPTALRTLIEQEDVDHHRSVSCAEYDGCLDVALRRCWRSWSCGRCSLFALAHEMRAAEIVQESASRPFA